MYRVWARGGCPGCRPTLGYLVPRDLCGGLCVCRCGQARGGAPHLGLAWWPWSGYMVGVPGAGVVCVCVACVCRCGQARGGTIYLGLDWRPWSGYVVSVPGVGVVCWFSCARPGGEGSPGSPLTSAPLPVPCGLAWACSARVGGGGVVRLQPGPGLRCSPCAALLLLRLPSRCLPARPPGPPLLRPSCCRCPGGRRGPVRRACGALVCRFLVVWGAVRSPPLSLFSPPP